MPGWRPAATAGAASVSLVPATALPECSDPDSYPASDGEFCAAEESGVVVLAEVSRTAA